MHKEPDQGETVATQLTLLKKDFFADDEQAVAVADRYPQDVFAEHTHEFCELGWYGAETACMC